MLFMVIERYRPGATKQIYERLESEGRYLPDDVSYHGSWIDHPIETCWMIMEAPDRQALQPWIDHWSDLVEFEVIPVRSSAETSAIARGADAS